MVFTQAGIETHPFIPFAAAFCISLFTSTGGVSGAFLLLPFQVSILGFTSPAVSATNHLFNIIAIPSGVYRYMKEGRLVWPLALIIIIGTLPGVFLGALVRIIYLPDPTRFKIFAGLVLGYIGYRLAISLIRKEPACPGQRDKGFAGGGGCPEKNIGVFQTRIPQDAQKKQVSLHQTTLTQIAFDYEGQTFSCSTPWILLLSFVVGMAGGIYGIGGGAIMAPFLVTMCGLPVYAIAGAALMGTCITSVAGVLFFLILGNYYPGQAISPDWLLGLLLGLGGTCGMYLGARLQKHLPSKLIKGVLCFCILFVAIRYILPLFTWL